MYDKEKFMVKAKIDHFKRDHKLGLRFLMLIDFSFFLLI